MMHHRPGGGRAAITDYREFPGRTHWIIAKPGWKEVATATAEWLEAKVPQATERPLDRPASVSDARRARARS